MEPLTLQNCIEATGGRAFRLGSAACVSRVETDSRSARQGDLFFALKGERFDAHDFLPEVVARGVAAVVVRNGSEDRVPAGPAVIVVDDTRAALGRLAAAYRRQRIVRTACVCGSNGKTSTKEMLADILATRIRTLRSEASFNNDIGVPLSLLRIDASHEAAVLEAGTNHPGELAPLVAMITPDVGLVPSIGREHLEHFGDLAGVVEEESALGRGLSQQGVLVLGGDMPSADVLAAATRARVVRAGFVAGNDWRVRLTATRWESTSFQLTAPHPEWCLEFELGVPGRHMVANAAVALAAAAAMGAEPEPARRALAAFRGAKQRLQWTEQAGVRLLDDTYNANADSMLAALQTLSDLPCAGRRVAILGDMAELGSHAGEAHREVGAAAGRLGLDVLVAIGRHSELTREAAAGTKTRLSFPDVESALPAVRDLLRNGDTVLAKASRSSRLERVIEALREHLRSGEPPSN